MSTIISQIKIRCIWPARRRALTHLQEAVKEVHARFDRFRITSFAVMLTQAKTLAEMAEFHTVLLNALLSSEYMQDVAAADSAAREALNLHLMDILLHGVIKQI